MVLVVVVDCDLLFWVCGKSWWVCGGLLFWACGKFRWVYGFGCGFGSFFFFWVYGRPRGFVVVCCFGFLVVIVFVLVGGLGDCGGCFGCCCWFQFWLVVVVVVVEFRLLDLDCSILGLGLNDRAWVVEKERQRGERVCSFIFIL